uniref:Uncharacterized protein n=2 Tax=Noccaea caerulescens TaxID=107243 RepID=A0A1J3EVI7_NOCCA
MSKQASLSDSCRKDDIHKLIDHTDIQEMPRHHERFKLVKLVNTHTTRSRGGSLVEEAKEKLKRFKISTVNILVGGVDEEQKK